MHCDRKNYFEKLFNDLGNNAGTYGSTTLADSETQTFFDSDWSDQLNVHLYVIARHAHLNTFWQFDYASNVSCSEEELRSVVVEEWGMTATFVLFQNVNLAMEFGVWMDGTWFAEYLTTFDVSSLNTTEQSTDVVASFSEVEQFSEHLDTGNNGLHLLFLETYDFNLVGEFDDTSLNSTSSNSTTAGDGEDILNWHQEWQILFSFWGWDVLVNFVHQLIDWSVSWIGRIVWCFQSFQSGTANDWSVIAWEVVFVEQVTDFHLYEFEQFWVVNLVSFVHEYNDVRNAYLTGEQDVLTGLWHWAVCSRYNEDSTVHLSSTSDHVLNVVSMSWAVNVSIVSLISLILYVSSIDCDTTFSFFWSFIDVCVIFEFSLTFEGQSFCDSSSQSGFAVVNVADSTNVNMWLSSFEFSFCHCYFLPCIDGGRMEGNPPPSPAIVFICYNSYCNNL